MQRILQAPDHYAVLVLARQAGCADVKKQYHRLSKLVHPDKCRGSAHAQATEAFQKVQAAYLALRDPLGRATYNAELSRRPPPRQPAAPAPQQAQQPQAPLHPHLVAELRSLRLTELKELCKRFGVAAYGSKSALQSRLFTCFGRYQPPQVGLDKRLIMNQYEPL